MPSRSKAQNRLMHAAAQDHKDREESWSAAEHSKGIRKRRPRTFRKIIT